MKISPYSFGNISIDLEQWRDELTNAWNNGKYAYPIVTAPPTWNAQPGESVLFYAASGGTTQYFYKNSAWVSSWSVIV